MIVTEPDQDPEHWIEVLNRTAGPGEWAAIPPAGSDWERADWESLALRVRVS